MILFLPTYRIIFQLLYQCFQQLQCLIIHNFYLYYITVTNKFSLKNLKKFIISKYFTAIHFKSYLILRWHQKSMMYFKLVCSGARKTLIVLQLLKHLPVKGSVSALTRQLFRIYCATEGTSEIVRSLVVIRIIPNLPTITIYLTKEIIYLICISNYCLLSYNMY